VKSKEKTVNEEEAPAASNFDDLLEVVFVVAGDTVDMRTVKTGIQDNDFIQILSGIKEGEEVVIGPYAAVSRKLERGSKIQIEKPDDKKKKKKEEEKVEVQVD
jgi:HlyD family secretion protein